MIERMALTHQTVTDLEELLGLLDTCRQSGWSCSDGELSWVCAPWRRQCATLKATQLLP